MLWDLNEGKHLYSLEAGDIINALVFSPNRYWLSAATSSCVKIFDLESKYDTFTTLLCVRVLTTHFIRSIVDELKPEVDAGAKTTNPECISLAWSADGQTLFGGFTDDLVRVWAVTS